MKFENKNKNKILIEKNVSLFYIEMQSREIWTKRFDCD